MNNYLCQIEKQLRIFISTSIDRSFFRTTADDCIILSTHSLNPITLTLFSDTICIDFADEYQEFDISNSTKLLPVLEKIGAFINELMTGALIYERVYYGKTQTICRVTLINKITKRKIHLRDTVLTSQYPHNVPRLIIREKLFFQ